MSLSKARDEFRLLFILRLLALIAATLVLGIVYFLGRETWPVLGSLSWSTFSASAVWSPSEGQYNVLPMLVASLMSTLLALCLAAPLGFLSAIFSQFYAPRSLKGFYRALIELLAGIPSVVYGFWGLTVLVPLLNRWHPPGASLLAGSLILSVMILPTIALMAEGSLQTVPESSILAAQALGLSTLGILRIAVWPSVNRGWLAAMLLACGRALGETMAMVMVCGNLVQIPSSVFDPVRTLTANMALEMAYAVGEHRAALFLSGFVLILLLMILVGWVSFLKMGERHAN